MPWALCKENSPTPKRALYALIQCLIWLRPCGTMGLIMFPDWTCPLGQTKDSINLFVEVGQTFDWINWFEWLVFSSRHNQCLRLSSDILLLVFGAWQRKSNIDSSQQQLKFGGFTLPAKLPCPLSASLLREGDVPASASTEPKQLSFGCAVL